MKRRDTRRGGDGFRDQVYRGGMPSELMSDDPQQVQCIGMTRFRRQNLPVERLRLCQPPGLVVLVRELEGLGDRQRGHSGNSRSEQDTVGAGNAISSAFVARDLQAGCPAHHRRHIAR